MSIWTSKAHIFIKSAILFWLQLMRTQKNRLTISSWDFLQLLSKDNNELPSLALSPSGVLTTPWLVEPLKFHHNKLRFANSRYWSPIEVKMLCVPLWGRWCMHIATEAFSKDRSPIATSKYSWNHHETRSLCKQNSRN